MSKSNVRSTAIIPYVDVLQLIVSRRSLGDYNLRGWKCHGESSRCEKCTVVVLHTCCDGRVHESKEMFVIDAFGLGTSTFNIFSSECARIAHSNKFSPTSQR